MPESLKTFSNCKRCNRALKNTKAQSIGYGAVCLKKHQAEAQQLLKTGQELGEGRQSSLTHFLTFYQFPKTPDLRKSKNTTF